MTNGSRWNLGRAPTSILHGLVAALLASCSSAQPKGDVAQVWTRDSTHLEVALFNPFLYSVLRLRADRSQLSFEELSDLEKLALVDPAAAGCVADGVSYRVSITRVDGTVATYDVHPSDACSGAGPLIAFSTFEPLSQAIPCLSPTLVPGPWRNETLVSDARCRDEMVMNEGTAAVPFEVDVAGETRHIELDQCDGAGRADSLHARILTATGTTPLAQATAPGDPGPDHTCLQIDHTFEVAGAYRLEIVADPGFLSDRDFYLRSY